ncbi:hypothetical protein K2P96_03025 [Patescibacteria group bacterium]|nr:hypothetical protein [Patescibacteria group bacterium]
MRQVSLKLKTYAGSLNGRVAIVNNGNLQRRILHIMLLSLGVLACLYVVMLTTMVINIVERKTLESRARSLTNEVSGMELSYLTMSNKIDPALGLSLGFKEEPVKFATRKSLGSVKITNNEI